MVSEQSPKRARKPLSVLSGPELRQLEEALDEVSISLGLAARLMGRAGLRVGEVRKLCWGHVDLSRSPAAVIDVAGAISKTGYGRQVPVGVELAERLRQRKAFDLERGGSDGIAGRPVITARNGSRPTVRWFQRIFSRCAQLSFGRKVSPHTLRHTFATRLLRHTNIRVVQDALGHRSLSSTQIYTHPTMADLRQAIEQSDSDDV